MDLKSFLIEKKNQRIFLLTIAFVIVFIAVIILFFFLLIKVNNNQQKKIETTQILPSPTKIPEQTNEETIQSLGYSIDCQLVITTSVKKIFIKKLPRCQNALDYAISPSKKYAAYVLIDKNKTTQLFVYSLENNVEGQLQIFSQPIVIFQFDSRNNLTLLLSDKLVYFFLPILFSGYPGNYYKELNTFTDIDKRKVEIPLPESKNPYEKITEQQNGIALIDSAGSILFSIAFTDLERALSPTPPPVVNRNLLKWDKRIFFYSQGSFKSMDMDGSNELTHKFICDGIEVVPIEFRHNLFARSPDGQTLVFLVPTEGQMRENPTWKNDIISGKKIFSQGELVLYDFVKDNCQKTGVVQPINYRENFSFSPNGQYMAFVNQGVSLYNLQNHQDSQLVSHNSQIESDSTAISGPLIWDGASKFIYTLVSKINNSAIVSTKLVRIYFDERLNGTEQVVMDALNNNTLYAISPDGSKILYIKDNQLFKYDVNKQSNSLFSKDSIDKINKIIWLRNGMIISNIWYSNENLYFTKLPTMSNFQVDFDGETIVYNPAVATLPNTISLYNLVLNRQKFFKDKKTINGDVLQLFY